MTKTLNDFSQELRARAISELAGDIEEAAPAQGVAKLSSSLYSLMLQTLDMTDDELELLDGIENAMAEFDHDLSDYLMLADYSVLDLDVIRRNAANIEDQGRPVIVVEIRYKNVPLTTFRTDIPTLKLMTWKRKRQTAA